MAVVQRADGPARPVAGRAERALEGVRRERLDALQRARILAGLFDVAAERGAAGMTVADIVERSGVSRRTFYEYFADREDCFIAAFEQALAHALARVKPAYEAGSWCERIRAAVIAFLTFLDEEPAVGRVLVAESLVSGPRALARRNETIAALIRILEQGRGESKTAAELSALTGEGAIGGALAILQTRLLATDREPLLGLANQLTSMLVLPYLGVSAARRELERPLPAPAASLASNGWSFCGPFKEAGMRLTYRTVRVLMAIAEQGERGAHPSNRLIGELAGIHDQGQVSKLLARLQRADLIANGALERGNGAANAWSLTVSGRQVTDGIRAHSERPS
jgi:AcrR family transcriptional regulator/DNA-binding MarR family transcriptional regulator